MDVMPLEVNLISYIKLELWLSGLCPFYSINEEKGENSILGTESVPFSVERLAFITYYLKLRWGM